LREQHRARPDAFLWRRLRPDAGQAPAAERAALRVQCAQDQLHPGADRRHRGRVLRHAGGRHGLSHLCRDRPHERRHGVGDDRSGGTCGICLLRHPCAHRAWVHLLAPVLSPGAELRATDSDRHNKEQHMRKLPILAGAAVLALSSLSAQAADKLPLQLKWVTQAQFAGYYVAKDKGFYKDENLDVTIKAGGPDVAPPQVIAGGGADVVGDWMPSALATREKGIALVNIAQVFKRSGMELTCRKDSGIKTPADFKGKTLGVWFGGNEYPFLSWMDKLKLKTSGADADIKVLKQGFNV